QCPDDGRGEEDREQHPTDLLEKKGLVALDHISTSVSRKSPRRKALRSVPKTNCQRLHLTFGTFAIAISETVALYRDCDGESAIMMIIYRAHRSVWRVLNQGKPVVDPNEARELSDKVTRKLVEVAREGVIDLDTLRERALAAFARAQAH